MQNGETAQSSFGKTNAESLGYEIFSGISDATKALILSNSELLQFPKGAVLFSFSEPANKFYLLKKGRVRLYKNNENGDEAVFGIVDAGIPVCDSILFKNSKYSVSAQAIDSLEVLVVPSDYIRSALASDHQFAMNMLGYYSNISAQRLQQLEQASLKSAAQRVGWFFLNEFIEKGSHKSNTFSLPFDKSLIASYLGMKPETFSRTLLAFKTDGIDIEKNLVSLPGVFALCEYCDDAITAKCSRHGTPECQTPIAKFQA